MSINSLHAETGQAEITPLNGQRAAVAAALLAAGSDVRYEDGVFIVAQAVADGATLPTGTLIASVTAAP